MGPGGKDEQGEDERQKRRPCAHLPFLTLNEGGLLSMAASPVQGWEDGPAS